VQAKDAQAKDAQAKDVQPKGIQYIRRYHGYKKKPQSKSKARKNMIAYLKNTKGFKMAYFKGKTYDQIHPIFQARFTLEQLVNVARLQVEEESEMSLELLRFTRQQLLEYQQE
nr:hypothetical protein [Tanacetum cinerariifolium]